MSDRKEDMARAIARRIASNAPDNDTGEGKVGVGVMDFSLSDSEKPRSKNSSPKKKPVSQSGSKKKKKKKRKNRGAKIAAVAAVLIILTGTGCGLLYLAGLNTYKGVFLDNTYINSINVSGLTQAKAYDELKAQSAIPEKITVTKKDGGEISIALEDVGYKDNTKQELNHIYSSQDHYGWLSAKFDKQEFTIHNPFAYEKDKLEAILKHKLIDTEAVTLPVDAYIDQSADGSYTVVSEKEGTKIDINQAALLYKFVEDQLDEGNYKVDISGVNCYENARVKAADLYEDCSKLNDLHNLSISFDFGYATETLDGDTLKEWVEVTPNSPVERFTVDRDQVMSYVEGLAEKYDTFGKDRIFETTKHGKVTIPQGEGCYGWWLDQEEMTNFIVRQIEDCESVETEPIYYVNPNSQYSYTCNPEWRTEDSDFSDTYFEVDLEAQHLYYYKDGKLDYETDIVSGYPSESRNTPGGVYKLWIKERGKTLVGSSDGQSYASYVEYWNNISTISIGFHDASWQNGVFGGEKYKSATWGSHGCINMPLDAARYIYENCDYGTPVFAYWISDLK